MLLPFRGSKSDGMTMDGGVADGGWLFATEKANVGCETAKLRNSSKKFELRRQARIGCGSLGNAVVGCLEYEASMQPSQHLVSH